MIYFLNNIKNKRGFHEKISVITPCYNSYDYLDKCFESLVNRSIGIENIEIIFVNDASTDNTAEKLLAFEAMYPDSVLVIHLDENVKQGGTRNVALQYVSGEYLVFIDSDDWVDLSYLETIYNIVKENDVDMLQIPFVHVRGEGDNATYTKPPAYWEGLYVMYDIEKRKHFLTHQLFNCGAPNKIYRTKMVRKAVACFLQGVAYEEPSFVYPLFSMQTVFTSWTQNCIFTDCTKQAPCLLILQNPENYMTILLSSFPFTNK